MSSPTRSASPINHDPNFDSENTPLHLDYQRPNSRPSSVHSQDGMDIDSRQSPRQLDTRTTALIRGSQSPSQSQERHRDSYFDEAQSQHNAGRDAYDAIRAEIPMRLHYQIAMTLEGHKKAVSAVKFSPDGTKIAAADGMIKIWNTETGRQEQTFEGHLTGISTIAWSPDSRWVASGGDDKVIRLWDVQTGKPHPVPFTGHSNYIFCLAFSPKGNMLVSGSHDEAVFLWDVRAARQMRVLPAHSDPVRGVDFVHDGTLIVSCSSDGLIRIWDTATGQCLRTMIHEDHAPVVGVRFSPNGKYVLAWTLDSSIRLWNYVEGRCVKTYQGHSNSKFSIGGAFGIYGPSEYLSAFVVSGSEDGAIRIWDVSSKRVLQTIESAHNGVVFGTDSHPSSKYIVSGGSDGKVCLWALDQSKLESSEQLDLGDQGPEKMVE